jgi:phosphate transport system substrate-binding protein
MRILARFIQAILLAVCGLLGSAWADESHLERMTIEQLRAEMNRLEGDIKALRNSPQAPASWKQSLTLETQLENASRSHWDENARLRRQLIALAGDQSFLRWQSRINHLNYQLERLNYEANRRAVERDKHAAEARHLELKEFQPQQTPRLRALGFDVLNYPQVDGSTSTQPLAALIACRQFGIDYAWLGRSQRWPSVPGGPRPPRREDEAELVEFTLRAVANNPREERLAAIINGLLATNASTHDAYVNLIEGKRDIALIARSPSPLELDLARAKGVELDALPCALDAFVFIVNGDNPVRGLTAAQLRAIYSHAIVDWQAVGGTPGKIVAYHREENSGSEELMRTLVMAGTGFRTPPRGSAEIAGSGMAGVFLHLTNEKQGIGYSVHYYERYMAGRHRTRVISVDGVEPKHETIRDRKYPYTCDVLVVIRKDLEEDAPARKLRDWIRSPEGQAVVRESGYVPNTAQER